MQIVIDIPENLYKATINGLDANEIWDLRLAVKNGIPLSEGDLISRADAIDACNQSINLFEAVDRIKELPRK